MPIVFPTDRPSTKYHQTINVLCSVTLLGLGACTKETPQEVVAVENAPTNQETIPTTPTKQETPEINPADLNCITLELEDDGLPSYFPNIGLTVTQIDGHCLTAEGKAGYKKDANFVAMGLPCSGGKGEIDWRGKLARPKLVTFLFNTDCPMNPSTAAQVSAKSQEMFGADASFQLLAYYPMAVQYWELPEANDADIGHTVHFRNGRTLLETWERFRNNEPIPIRLYGRQNSWGGNQSLFRVEGDLLQDSGKHFIFRPSNVKALNGEQIDELAQKCYSLRPKRDCGRVF